MNQASSLRLYNTFTKKEEVFIPIRKGEVTMYTCGPTVYGRPHIGNYSSFLMADLLRRWLEVSGYTVKHVKNITDVGHLLHDADHGDDKIQKEAEKQKLHPLEVAQKYTEQYLADEKELNMLEPFARPRASEFVPQMIAIIRALLKNGHAYETEDGIYFDVQSFPQYGALSGNPLENLLAGARIEVDETKKHPADFALWKKCVGGNGRHILRWNFESGEVSRTEGEDSFSGFPGWHIECSAMSSALLGEQIDIHTGGEDNIFPHHECEIAQSECATGKNPFVRIWLHKRRIDMGSEKMSKSLGNVLSVDDIRSMGYDPLDLRYLFLSVHYRTQLKFTRKALDDAHKARRRVMEWMGEQRQQGQPGQPGQQSVEAFQAAFIDAMNADLNTSGALAAVFECMTWSRSHDLSGADRAALASFITMIRETFGCFAQKEEMIPAQVQALLNDRAAARASKNFAESDRLRDAIHTLGYEVRDLGTEQKVEKL